MWHIIVLNSRIAWHIGLKLEKITNFSRLQCVKLHFFENVHKWWHNCGKKVFSFNSKTKDTLNLLYY